MPATPVRQEHVASYYFATANDATRRPALEEDLAADVCVVGGGFTGVAAALTLAERGYSVVVLEANRVGWGATGRNGGQLINGISGLAKVERRHGPGVADLLWDLRWRGNDIVFDRVARYGIDCDLKTGYLEAAVKPRHLRELEDWVAELERRRFPYPYELLDRAGVREAVGAEGFVGGLVCQRDGHLHPLNLCLGEARAAEGLGARIFEHSPATGIRHGARPRVETARGSVTADAVLLAGNAYQSLEAGRLSNLVFPAGSFIIATEPLAPDVARAINPRDLAVSDMNVVLDYWRLSADRRLLYGGRCNYSGREPASIAATIRPRMLKLYPQLADARIDYEWGGAIGIVLNRIPAVGRIGGNVYYSLGYSGHGVNASHIMGEVVADAIGGTLETFDLFARIRHFRIPGSQWFGNQLVALGMLWYRMRDLL